MDGRLENKKMHTFKFKTKSGRYTRLNVLIEQSKQAF